MTSFTLLIKESCIVAFQASKFLLLCFSFVKLLFSASQDFEILNNDVSLPPIMIDITHGQMENLEEPTTCALLILKQKLSHNIIKYN